ncbi:hypothetical protein Clacol_003127 [Clathrus columnatus]|uniref:NAD-dependent epimerase/dehydratase domain-containing protein n=1 Tax=Clathrus columnatus TaxID=1419009 RepID=A0AAV5A5Y5_9AGAM|nr:hypothetical protein Clacol_003127 [Clathrus columnatus]
MPSVTSGKVLITGANGFISRWIIKTFLDAGFTVRGTVRSTSKGEALKELFKTEKFEYVIVEDISNLVSETNLYLTFTLLLLNRAQDSFDQYLKDVDVVIHAAFLMLDPTIDPQADPDVFIKPAVDGTVKVLESILRAGHVMDTVKRVVILSSLATIADSSQNPEAVVYDEEHWASLPLKVVQEEGKAADNLMKYAASKILAERAAWDLYDLVKHTAKWDLVTLNPVYPILEPFPTTDLSKLSGSNLYLWSIIHGEPTSHDCSIYFLAWVDVRDVAEASLKAVTVEEAANNRFIILSDHFIIQELLDAIHTDDPNGEFDSLGKGTPRSGRDENPFSVVYSNKKSQEILGIKYRTIRDSAKDLARTVVSRV